MFNAIVFHVHSLCNCLYTSFQVFLLSVAVLVFVSQIVALEAAEENYFCIHKLVPCVKLTLRERVCRTTCIACIRFPLDTLQTAMCACTCYIYPFHQHHERTQTRFLLQNRDKKASSNSDMCILAASSMTNCAVRRSQAFSSFSVWFCFSPLRGTADANIHSASLRW